MIMKGREIAYKIRTLTLLEDLPYDTLLVLKDLQDVQLSKKK